jgi:LmbE family N-acetylglucosaminyl deacetylase
MRQIPVLAALLGLLTATSAPCQAQVPATFPGVRSLLWIGAHPDDEILAAPLLARLCIEEAISCTFLVLTRGEAGPCRLANGCHPDLGTVRSREMQRSARIFNAKLHLWDLPDGGGIAGWSTASGGNRALVDRVSSLLDAVLPDLVLTFDPRHGSTCHSDHRAAAEIVLEALEQVSRAPIVYLLETRVAGTTSPFSVGFSSAAPAAAATIGFDANQRLDSPRVPAWQFLLQVAQSHPSQFDQPALRGLRKVSARQRVVFFAPATMALASDAVWACN